MRTESTAKTKRRWLLATTIKFLCIPFLYAIPLICLDNANAETNLTYIAVVFFWGILWWFSLRHWAYKKGGTKLLSTCLILGTLGCLKTLLEGIKGFTFSNTATILYIIILILDLAVFIWWALLSDKLIKINKTFGEACKSKTKSPSKKKTNNGYHIVKSMLNDSHNLKRGIHRVGFVISVILSIPTAIVLLCAAIGDFTRLHLSDVIGGTLVVILLFLVPLLLSKGISWIIEGFQTSHLPATSHKQSQPKNE